MSAIFRYPLTNLSLFCLTGNRNSFIPSTIRLCFFSRSADLPVHGEHNAASHRSIATSKTTPVKEFILISYCFIGLMVSYLTWGLLQEKIMTQEYESIDTEGNKHADHFKDSQFLVFANRTLAFLIALTYLYTERRISAASNRPLGTITASAPLFKYSFASFSNIMSAWFQYEALKFVNFPTQVLAKSCKIIPVMLMGKIVSRTKFDFYEYFTAVLISIGMLFFLLGNGSSTHAHSTSTIASLTGILLLTLYLTFDSFTSNWQSDLFKTYKITSIQMMCGVNLFSSLFTGTSIAIQGGFMESMVFATTVNIPILHSGEHFF